MRFPDLVLVVLALSAGGNAQSSGLPSSPDAPVSSSAEPAPPPASASSQAAIPNSEPSESQPTSVPLVTSALLSSAHPSVRIKPPSASDAKTADNPPPSPAPIGASSRRPEAPGETAQEEVPQSPQVSTPVRGLSPAGGPVSTAGPAPPGASVQVIVSPPTGAPASSMENDPAIEPSPNIPISNQIQGTQVRSDSPQASDDIVSGQIQASVAATAGPPHVSGIRAVNGTDRNASARPSGTGSLGAGPATPTFSSPELATTASFGAQPSDGFRTVNDTTLEATPESNVATPLDVATADELHAELAVNIPSQGISEKNAKAIAVLETAYFEYFVTKDPAPVDVGKISIPPSISKCQSQYSEKLTKRKDFVDAVLDWVPLMSRDLRGFDNCKAVDSLEVGVYFHYMRESPTAARPNELEARVKAQVDTLNEALGAVRINFRFMALNWWEPKADEDWSKVSRREKKLTEWQQRTRAPGKSVLTVWIVNGLRDGGKEDQELNSYATFPNEKLDEADGIVIQEAHVQGGDATTLVHDVGHWFGLGHTFDEIGQECLVQSGLTNATQTSGNRDVVYQCSQVTCAGGPAVEVNNYMSYSSCRGKTPRDGFTTDQKARMFANALQFRRGYESGECMPDGTAAVKKRSSMQDLLDGRCPDVDKQANILMNVPHSSEATLLYSTGRLLAMAVAPCALILPFF